jgi:hypothetical protein
VVLKFANLSPGRGIWVDLPDRGPRRWLIEAAARAVDGVVAISSRIARAAEEQGWRRVSRIPNGIDLVATADELPPRAQARRRRRDHSSLRGRPSRRADAAGRLGAIRQAGTTE